MNEPEAEWLLASWVRLVQARWVIIGVSRAERSELLQTLLRDLATARAAGARTEDLIATPPAVFADSCAAGLASRTTRIGLAPLLTVCLGTGVVAAGASWMALNVVIRSMGGLALLDQVAFALALNLLLAVSVLAAMVVAVRWTFRLRQQTAALTSRLVITLSAGAVLGFPFASGYGVTQAYSTRLGVIVVESLIMLTFLALATALAHQWARPATLEIELRTALRSDFNLQSSLSETHDL